MQKNKWSFEELEKQVLKDFRDNFNKALLEELTFFNLYCRNRLKKESS